MKMPSMNPTLLFLKPEVQRMGLVDIIHDDLLEGSSVKKDIHVEIYKLNVCGKLHCDMRIPISMTRSLRW